MREWYHVICKYSGSIDLGVYDIGSSNPKKITSLDLWKEVLPAAIDTSCSSYLFPLLLVNCGYYNEDLEEILEYEFSSTCMLLSPYSLKELSQELYNYFQIFHPEFKVWRLGMGRL